MNAGERERVNKYSTVHLASLFAHYAPVSVAPFFCSNVCK